MGPTSDRCRAHSDLVVGDESSFLCRLCGYSYGPGDVMDGGPGHEDAVAQDGSGHADDNTVYVGSKPAMNYALAVVTQLNDGHDLVNVKARGKAISRAVDVAEIVRNRFRDTVDVDDIVIGTDEIDTDDGETINVSSIHIRLDERG